MSDGHNAIEGTATDPVCGMSVKMDGARFIDRHKGGDHYSVSYTHLTLPTIYSV